MKRLFQVTLHNRRTCAGFEVDENHVCRAAPILKWMVNRRLADVLEWLLRKGIEFREVRSSEMAHLEAYTKDRGGLVPNEIIIDEEESKP